jgi:predicted metal-dependent hydrolase
MPGELLFERGRLHFNAGRFFEAHEAWEEAWRAESGTARLLLQGLIQVAAGYHKAFHGRRPDGCARLLTAGLEKLRAALKDSPDHGLEEFLARVEGDAVDASRWEQGEMEGLARSPTLDERALHHTGTPTLDRGSKKG